MAEDQGQQNKHGSAPDARVVIDGIPGLVAILAPDGAVAAANPQLGDYCGLSVEGLKDWVTNGIVHPEDVPLIAPTFIRSIDSGEPYDFECRIRRFDGVYRWFQIRGLPFREAGHIVRWYVLLTDIDDRRQAETALAKRERDLQLIIDSIPAGAALMTASGDVEVVNRHLSDYFGKTPDELRRWSMADTVHPDDHSRVSEALRRSLSTGEPYDSEERHRRFDGAYRWFRVQTLPIRDDSGAIVRWNMLHTDIDERRRAEDELRDRERQISRIVESIPALAIVADAAGRHVFTNRRVLDYYGKTFEELRDWSKRSDLVHPDDVAHTIEVEARTVALGIPYYDEYRLRRHDGVYRWFEGRGQPYYDESGKLQNFYLLLNDIDDRKRAEQALAESERNLQLIVDATPALIWSANAEGEAISFNRHYVEYVGRSIDALRHGGWVSAVHPQDVDAMLALWRLLLREGIAGHAEARLRRQDGVYRWFLFQVQPLRDQNGTIVRWHGVNIDIEDRRQAEEELRRSEAFLAQGEAVSETGSFLWDLQTNDIRWSQQLYRIFEWDFGSRVTLERIGGLVHPDDIPNMEDMVRRAQAGLDSEYVHRLLFPDGEIKHLHFVAKSVRDRDGRHIYIGSVQNITKRKQVEEALDKARSEIAHASRTMSLGVLTASIAHEVNQPLSGIVTNAATCLRMLGADPANLEGARATAQRTLRDAQRASEIISRLRTLFTNKQPNREPVDLSETVYEVINLLSTELRGNRVSLRTELDPDLPPVMGDRVQLQQVILNLIVNALDAMKSVDDRPRDLLVKTLHESEGRARLLVRDSGVGIDPANVGKLFDAFYTTKPQGMGVGLSISRSIIESHDGRLWADANDGPGATFSIRVPCSAAPAGAHTR